MEQEELQKTIELLGRFMEKYEKVKAQLPYDINLISLIEDIDENTHSRILERLLNYKTANGRYEILESFIACIKEKAQRENKQFKIDAVKKPIITQEKERIDLWIRDKEGDYAIVIENKINWAQDQFTQLERYIDKTIKAGFENIYVLYLPLTDKDPESQSWGKYHGGEIYRERYLKLPFKDDILPWLKEIPIRLKETHLAAALVQYINYLERILHMTEMDKELQKIKDELKLDEKDWTQLEEMAKAIKIVQEEIETERKERMSRYWQEWKQRLEHDFPGYKIVYNSDVNIPLPEIGLEFDHFKVLIEYNVQCKKLYYGILKKGENDNAGQAVLEAMTEKGFEFYKAKEKHVNTWKSWYAAKETSFERGYDDLADLIREVIKALPE